jgi:hypothetical protein
MPGFAMLQRSPQRRRPTGRRSAVRTQCAFRDRSRGNSARSAEKRQQEEYAQRHSGGDRDRPPRFVAGEGGGLVGASDVLVTDARNERDGGPQLRVHLGLISLGRIVAAAAGRHPSPATR